MYNLRELWEHGWGQNAPVHSTNVTPFRSMNFEGMRTATSGSREKPDEMTYTNPCIRRTKWSGWIKRLV